MSSGQKTRTREHFPRMKDRAGRRRVRRQVQRYRHFRQRVILGTGFGAFAAAAGLAMGTVKLGFERLADELSKLPPVGAPTAEDLERLGERIDDE